MNLAISSASAIRGVSQRLAVEKKHHRITSHFGEDSIWDRVGTCIVIAVGSRPTVVDWISPSCVQGVLYLVKPEE